MTESTIPGLLLSRFTADTGQVSLIGCDLLGVAQLDVLLGILPIGNGKANPLSGIGRDATGARGFTEWDRS